MSGAESIAAITAVKRATSDGRIVDVRPLSDKEVCERGLHREKEQQGYRPTDTVYEDTGTGETFIGSGSGRGVIEPFP